MRFCSNTAFPGGAGPCGDDEDADMKYDVDRMIKPLMNAFVWCMQMRDTSIVGIDGADNRTLQHVRSSGDGAESVIPLIQQADT
uniref:Uncharacterized protein n=1 Tax=Oryza barthii TaxID=65489 RepID=A0A0D3FH74_9ORYZ